LGVAHNHPLTIEVQIVDGGGAIVTGCQMSVEIIDGIRILKLHDDTGYTQRQDDARLMVYIWRQLSGCQSLRDATVGDRQML
jgi:hypothetical protein